MIFHQQNYALTRLLGGKGCEGLKDLRATKDDAKVATYHARGFGIEDEDIIYIEDMSITEIDKIVMDIKK